MLRRTLRILSGGHGDLFPNSKEAAHLAPHWVLSRKAPPAPGKGKSYASFTAPEHHSKFTSFSPEAHTEKVISIHAKESELHGATVARSSAGAVAKTLAGVNTALQEGAEYHGGGHHHHHGASSSSSHGHHASPPSHKPPRQTESIYHRMNVLAKQESEVRARTRDDMLRKRPLRYNPNYIPTLDIHEAMKYQEKYASDHDKLLNDNKNGYTKENVYWDVSTPLVPVPPKPAK